MELSPLIAFVWIELTFVTIGALLFILIYSLGQKAKRKKAVNTFFQTIKADRQRRMDEIRQALLGYGLDENDVEKRLRNIDHHEMNLYQHIGLIYIKNSDVLLKTINVAQETTTQSFLDLGLSAGSENAGGADQSELDALRTENENLKSELGVTMDTIGRMLSEYSSMFGSDMDDGLDKDKIMESFDSEENEELDAADDDLNLSLNSDEEPVDSEELLEISEELPDFADSEELLEISDDTVADDELLEIADEAFAQVDEPEHDSVLETVEPEAEVASEPDIEPEQEVEIEQQVAAEIEAEAEPESEPDAELAAEVALEPEIEPDSDLEPEPATDLADLDVDQILAEAGTVVDDDFDPVNENVTADEINAALDELELSDMIDIESDLADAVESAGQAADVDISDVQIEDMDEFDIDALLEKHVEKS